MKVVKFGGSSLASADAVLKARDIVLADSERRFIVVSAPGKCKEKSRRKVTDLLIDAQAELSADDCRGADCSESLNAVISRFKEMSKSLGVEMNNEIERTREEMSINCHDRDFVVSRGEYLMGLMFAKVLGFRFVDAANLVVIKSNGKCNEAATCENFVRSVNKNDKIVMGGFYGRGITGGVRTFTRGGSDCSGAIAAVCLGADEYENFTDTFGVQTANPLLVVNTQTVSELDFGTMYKLSIAGASVLHPDCLPILKKRSMPLKVDNTFAPGVNYTRVTAAGGVGKYFCITYKFKENINKDMVEILCVFSKIDFELSGLRKVLLGIEVYLVEFKPRREFVLLAPTSNLESIINVLHDYFCKF